MLDLEAIRDDIAASPAGRVAAHATDMLAAIDRVLAIPKHEIPVLDPPGAFAIQAAQNATLNAVRAALGVEP